MYTRLVQDNSGIARMLPDDVLRVHILPALGVSRQVKYIWQFLKYMKNARIVSVAWNRMISETTRINELRLCMDFRLHWRMLWSMTNCVYDVLPFQGRTASCGGRCGRFVCNVCMVYSTQCSSKCTQCQFTFCDGCRPRYLMTHSPSSNGYVSSTVCTRCTYEQ